MNRPILWALGILGSTTITAVGLGPRLAGFTESSPAVQTRTSTTAPAAEPAGRRSFTVAADYRGHFVVHPTVSQFRLRMLVDTGASLVTLTELDARNLGLRPRPGDYNVTMDTANGRVMAARVHLDELTIGSITVRRVEALVMPAAALDTSLLGMSFLRRLSGFEIAAGRLTLKA
jgi:aspartyl protease family protein